VLDSGRVRAPLAEAGAVEELMEALHGLV